MIKQPSMVRARLLKLLNDTLFAFRTHISMMPELESDVLNGLEPVERMNLTVELTDVVLAKFGHVQAPKEPRFSKTRRAYNKRIPKGPRGVPRKQSLQEIPDAP